MSAFRNFADSVKYGFIYVGHDDVRVREAGIIALLEVGFREIAEASKKCM